MLVICRLRLSWTSKLAYKWRRGAASFAGGFSLVYNPANTEVSWAPPGSWWYILGDESPAISRKPPKRAATFHRWPNSSFTWADQDGPYRVILAPKGTHSKIHIYRRKSRFVKDLLRQPQSSQIFFDGIVKEQVELFRTSPNLSQLEFNLSHHPLAPWASQVEFQLSSQRCLRKFDVVTDMTTNFILPHIFSWPIVQLIFFSTSCPPLDLQSLFVMFQD